MSANWYEPNKKRCMATNSCLGKAQAQLVGKLETLSSSAKTPAAKLKDLDKVFSDVVRFYRRAASMLVDQAGQCPGHHPPHHPTAPTPAPTCTHTACR